MSRFIPLLTRFLRSEDGPTSVEYAVMLALIVGACIASIGLVGLATLDLWANNDDGVSAAFDHLP